MPQEDLYPTVPSFVEITENIHLNRRTATTFAKEEADVCQCRIENGVGCTESCLNRSLFTECISGTCPCGDACQNQRLQKRQWAKVSFKFFGEKGWGVIAEEALKTGQLVVEYIGEVCDLAEVEKRALRYERLGLRNTYIMNLNSHEVIDATEVGNYSRFINHSCNPNAECQKWNVGGEQRIAIFAFRDIQIGEEITYNYNLDWNGGRRVKCRCGAPNCTGFLGAESVLWKKTVCGVKGAHTERYGRDGKDASAPSASKRRPRFKNRFGFGLSRRIMTRSIFSRFGNFEVNPWNGSETKKHKRQRIESPSVEPPRLKPKPKPKIEPRPVVKTDAETSPLPKEPLQQLPTRQFPLMATFPLPKKFTTMDAPIVVDGKSVHPTLLSVTDVIPLSDIIRDPFMILNQEYYMAVGDVKLLGLLYSNGTSFSP